MGKDLHLWSEIGEPGMFYRKTEYGLSNQAVFDQGRIRPGGKIHFKTVFLY